MLYAFRDESALLDDTALKIACGFGAGMGRNEQVCGAIAGGILVLGLRHGRGTNDDKSATESTYQKTRQLMAEFVAKHGTYICRELLCGCELTTPEGQKKFKDHDLLRKVCAPAVQSVAEILENIA